MASMAMSILRSGASSKGWDGCFPKLVLPIVSANSREPNFLWHRKFHPHLRRASPLKGNIKEIEQSVDDSEKGQLVRAQGVDGQQPQIHDEGDDGSSVITHANAKGDPSMDNVGSSQKVGMPTTETKEEVGMTGDAALKGSVIAGLLVVGAVGGFGAAGYIYRDQINAFLLEFSDFIDDYGIAGYALFVALYAALEIAATAAFLIARYLVRDRILKLAEGNKKFLAIDKAIGENSFRVVTLLRLSPLLPFSLGNYLYGLTSVKLVPYIFGSWLGMLPGTWAYVSAGAVGRALLKETENPLNEGPEQLLTLGGGILITVIAAMYVTRLAKDAIKDVE